MVSPVQRSSDRLIASTQVDGCVMPAKSTIGHEGTSMSISGVATAGGTSFYTALWCVTEKGPNVGLQLVTLVTTGQCESTSRVHGVYQKQH